MKFLNTSKSSLVGIVLLLLIFNTNIHAQTFEWAKKAGGIGADVGYSTCMDAAGNTYVTGQTYSTGFSGVTPGAFQSARNGANDAFVMKYDNTGNLVWGTYFGGSGSDSSLAIAIDASGNLYIAGKTTSTNLSVLSAFQATYAGGNSDAFVAQFNANTGALQWSTYCGGSNNDYISEIKIDNSNRLLTTGSSNSNNFPTTPGAFRTTNGGGSNYNGFITRFLSNGSLDVSTYYGGIMGSTYSYAVDYDSGGNIYITGATTDYGLGTSGTGYTQSYGSDFNDAIIAKFNSSLNTSSLIWSTYYSGSGVDKGVGITCSSSKVYVLINTQSANLTTQNPGGSAYFNGIIGGSQDAFIAAFNLTNNSLLWATYFGGSGPEYPSSVVIDNSDNVLIIGTTQSTDMYTLNPGGVSFQGGNAGGKDAFMLKFNPFYALVWSTYLGGVAADDGYDIAAQAGNPSNIYITGSFQNTVNFPPATPTPLTSIGNTDVFAARMNDCATFGITASSNVSVCTNASTTLTANGATSYTWIPSTYLGSTVGSSVIHTPLVSGAYNYTVTGTSGACSFSKGVNTTALTLPVLTVTASNSSVCNGSSLTLTASGASSYTWSPPAGLSTTAGIVVTASPTATSTYIASGPGTNGCIGSGNINVNVTQAKITGKATYSGGDVAGNIKTFAKLFSYAVNKEMQLKDSVGLNGNGVFNFINLSSKDTFLVYVKADTGTYHNTVGTYHTNAFEWINATTVVPSCPATSANITMIETQAANGNGSVSGKVVEGEGFGKKDINGKKEAAGDGIKDVEVGLKKKPGGQLSLITKTDANGDYHLQNVPAGDYTMFVDIPGLPVVSSHTVSITTNEMISNANFEADSNKIEAKTSTSIKEFTKSINKFIVYPNPASSRLTIVFDYAESRKVTILNAVGEVVSSEKMFGKMLEMNTENLSSGIYYLQVVSDKESISTPISILK